MPVTHDAFISYSHNPDAVLGPAVENALEQLAKPLLKRRACDVFLDQTSLGVDTSVWGSIVPHLEGTRWFLLLASPQSANSPWCLQEVEWWLAHHGTERLLILVTGGDIEANDERTDFDWRRTTALPKCLTGRFSQIPLWGDLRAVVRDRPPTMRDPEFRKAIVGVAATMRGIRRDELDAEDLRIFRRNRKIIAAILLASIAAVGFAGVKTVNGINLNRAAAANALVQNALSEKQENPAKALLQATLAQRLSSDGAATLALVEILDANRRQVRSIVPADPSSDRVTAVAINDRSNLIALARCEDPGPLAKCRRTQISFQTIDGATPSSAAPQQVEIGLVRELEFTTATGKLLLSAEDGAFLIDPKNSFAPAKMLVRGQRVVAATFSADEVMFAAALASGSSPQTEVKLWEIGAGIRCSAFFMRRVQPNGIAFSPTSRHLAVADDSGQIVVTDLESCARTELRMGDSTGAVGFDPSGNMLFAVMLDGTGYRWQVGTGPQMHAFGGEKPLVTSQDWRTVSPHAISADGRLVALADDLQIRVDALASPREETVLKGFPSPVVRIRFSTDGRWLVSTHADHSVLLWRLADEQRLEALLADGDPELKAIEAGWQKTRAIRADSAVTALVVVEPDRDVGGDTPGARWTLRLTAGGINADIASGNAILDPPQDLQFTPGGKLWVRTEQGKVSRWDIDPASLEAKACIFAGRRPTTDELDNWLSGQWIVRWQVKRGPACEKPRG